MVKEKKKSSFINDSFISIFGVVACKVIGLLYVIPFYAMISTAGGALYSYAYSIYTLFLSLSTSGIPAAMSKIISEYNSLGYNNTKIKVYKIGLSIMMILGIVGFILMMVFAPQLAHMLIGNMKGGNSISDIAFVIRIISSALLIVPMLSVTKGYFQGQKMFKQAAWSNVIEQVARVAFLLIGCYLCIYKFKIDEKFAIAVAVFSATIGAVAAYLYLYYKKRKNKEIFSVMTKDKKEEKGLDKKTLAKQIIACAVPFIVIDLLKSAYGMVDSLTVVRGMTYMGYSAEVSELALSTFATWGAKLTMIVISISMGLTTSLIPNIASDNIKGDHDKVNRKISLAIIMLLFITLPMTIGISFLAKPIWIIFYSYKEVSIDIFKLFIFTAASFAIYSVIINIAQTLNHTKQVLITLATAFILNFIGNIPFMYLCHKLGMGSYQGASICTLITELLPALYLLIYIKKKHNLKFKELTKNTFKIILCNLIMVVSLILLSQIIPLNSLHKTSCMIEVLIYAFVGMIVYIITSYFAGLIKEIGGDRILKKLRLKS